MKICIFCGGAGTRMWPVSRRANPKQFQPTTEGKSLFQLMVERLKKGFKLDDIYVVTGKEYQAKVQKQASYLPRENFILEPEMRDTAAAVGYATAYLEKKFPGEVMAAIWGSDHIVKNDDKFIGALKLAGSMAQKENIIVKVDVKPTFPNPHLGYIKIGKKLGDKSGFSIYEFIKHVEKPNVATAKKYVASGEYFWNTGYLVWKPSVFMNLIEKHSPSLFRSLKRVQEKIDSDKNVMAKEYAKIPKISVDYAVFEKLNRGEQKVVEADLGWTDVGAWDALKNEMAKDTNANVIDANHVGVDTANTLIYGSDKNKLIATIGLNDMIIVDTEDGLLICPASRSGDVKKIIKLLKKTKNTRYL